MEASISLADCCASRFWASRRPPAATAISTVRFFTSCKCERFGLGDLVHRLGLTPLHRGFQIGSGVQPQPLRFLTGMGDDVFGFLQRIALTALV